MCARDLVLKLRKVELLGFKSFCEKTPITFSGTGITCIVGPNGCGKSNVVDAISWVLGEQSHKMLRAERMSDCIFNGTAKRPPMGLSEVTLTLVDPELVDAFAKVVDTPEKSDDFPVGGGPMIVADAPEPVTEIVDGLIEMADGSTNTLETTIDLEAPAAPVETGKPFKRKDASKPAMNVKPGEIVVGRRLYRSGQSEYVINGRVARLRDVQELFMGMGLGPDSYAIIEQGRIGQILNSKPMDRRAIIEEAAGITMYKTKRRLAEAKLEASKVNLSRVHDILVEVEKQLASLKRQASKARRYAELREQMRELLRSMLASKAEHLDIEAARIETLLREMDLAEGREAASVHELETEQERLNARSYELDTELRQTQNLLGQTALDLDRSENRITFNREQVAQIQARSSRLAVEIEIAERQLNELSARMAAHREAVLALRDQTASLEAGLRETTEHASTSIAAQQNLESRITQLRQISERLVEESARQQAESQQADEAAARHSAAEEQRMASLRSIETEVSVLSDRVATAEVTFSQCESAAQQFGAAAHSAQERLVDLRRGEHETGEQLEKLRENLSGERARHASIEQILSERAYTADAVQKLFNVAHDGASSSQNFRAVGLLADYTEVQEKYESAIEQFLRDELEYVVVESFDQARAGVSLLRDEMGGRATFFVDSLNKLNLPAPEAEASLPLQPGVLGRLDRLVDFRDPLGPAAKHFLTRLRTAYVVESAAIAEQMANENPHSYFLTSEGTCYHGRMVSGGRAGDAGPLALKRELRQHETEAARLELAANETQGQLTYIEGEITAGEQVVTTAIRQQMDAEKALVAATHQRDQARADLQRIELQFSSEREEISRLHSQAESARQRATQARADHAEAVRSREAAETESTSAVSTLAQLRHDFQAMQENVVARREELATMSERLTSAESAERHLVEEIALATERADSLREQHDGMLRETAGLGTSCQQLTVQAEELRKEKTRMEEQKAALDAEWEIARTRTTQLDDELRGKRTSLDELRAERNQRQIEKARNDADRDYLRQTCVAELNAQPEELIALQPQLLIGEELIAAETNYNEMKARVDAIGPVNMMALEEFKECEERDTFMRRERDDLVTSIQNTQLTINELDTVSKQKFEEAFNFINTHFTIAFQSLFGGGHGEMRLGEPDSSGETGIDIVAQPPGKRLQNLLLLSGGEKALTALALLIAVFKYSPSPFCILDEVDAPLDEANVGRFNRMLRDMCAQTQFIVVTHNRKTMEMGSVLYGVTMQEPGVSKLVSVKWEDAPALAAPKTASNAA